MFRAVLVALSVLLVVPAACPQTTQTGCPDAQTMQSLLNEVRQLRQDLQTVAVAARRAQILIYRLYMQQAIVAHASENLQMTQNQLEQLRAQLGYANSELKRNESMRDEAENAEQRKQFEDRITELKAYIETATRSEQEMQIKESGLEAQLRDDQGKLEQLQAQLDQLDSVLQNSAVQAAKR